MKYDSIIGSGWSFPIGVDARGRIALAHGERDIEEAIRTIVMTPLGQRVMRPRFGSRIHELVFASDCASTRALARQYVWEALAQWEPRIRLHEVQVRSDPTTAGALAIHVSYEVRSTYDRRALVVPFYTIPQE